jgi:predicted phage replisome organizer
MSDNKMYYYLKLKENFFDRAEIKAIEGMQNGYEYICIMQKMYLRSLERDGKLMLTDTVPYDLNMLSTVLNHRDDTIKCAIEIFTDLGLCEIMSDKSIYMTEIQNFIGKSSTEGDRKRIYRDKIKTHKQLTRGQTSGQCPAIKADVRPPELELKKEIELEIEQEIYTCKYFTVYESQHKAYFEAYPDINIIGEYKKMLAWLESNPKKRKSDYPKFINNWLSKSQSENRPQEKKSIYEDLEPLI